MVLTGILSICRVLTGKSACFDRNTINIHRVSLNSIRLYIKFIAFVVCPIKAAANLISGPSLIILAIKNVKETSDR